MRQLRREGDDAEETEDSEEAGKTMHRGIIRQEGEEGKKGIAWSQAVNSCIIE